MARVRGRRWRLYDPPFHIHYFSRQGIRELLGAHGLQVERDRSVGFSRSVNTMLHRVCSYKKPKAAQAVYHAAKQLGLTRYSVYLNLFDIMLVVARKGGANRDEQE
jgi:hypothetical protein